MADSSINRSDKILVGLGNPGRGYNTTRHNIGFMVLDEFASALGFSFQKKCPLYEGAFSFIGDKSSLFVKPLTYMNLSGRAVQRVFKNTGLSGHDLLVIHDDMDIPFGRIRLSFSASDGGHKGIRSIQEILGTRDFFRFRVGVGRAESSDDTISHVLGRFNHDEKQCLPMILKNVMAMIEIFFDRGQKETMNIFHGRDISTGLIK